MTFLNEFLLNYSIYFKMTTQKDNATCFYCSQSFRRDYLKIHTQNAHSDQPVREKGEKLQGRLDFSCIPPARKQLKLSEQSTFATTSSSITSAKSTILSEPQASASTAKYLIL